MPTNTSRATYDTYIAEPFPKTNYGNRSQIQLAVGTGNHKYAYVYFAGAPKQGATVFSATLSVWLRGSGWATGGPYTIKASRVTDQWYESKITWNRSNGGADHSTTHQASSAAISGGVDSQQVDIDVTGIMSDVASGQGWYGLFLEVDNSPAPGYLELYSSETTYTLVRPRLTVVWATPPDAPTDMAPAGGTSVSVSKPVLKWVYKDKDGDGQASYQVQLNGTSSFTTPAFDTGWVSDTSKEVDLSLTAYAGVSGTQYWRVRVQDVNGLTSDWSATASFIQTVKGSLTIANPPNGGFVEETTPPITTTLTGQAQDAIAYKLEEQQSDGSWLQVWSSGRFSASAANGVAFDYTVPHGYIKKNGNDYRVTVWSYDTVDREATPGDPIYTAAQSTFTFQRSAVPTAVTDTTLAPDGGAGAKLTFSRDTQPDYFALRVDDVLVFDRIDPLTIRVPSGTTYKFESGLAGFTDGNANTNIAVSAAQFYSGAQSLAITSVAAGVTDAHGPTFPVNPGDEVAGTAQFLAAGQTESVRVQINWLDSGGGYIATTTPASVVDSAAAWTQVSFSGTAPAGAAQAYLIPGTVTTLAASETHYVDEIVWQVTNRYAMTYYGAKPNTQHTFEIEAVVTDTGKLKHSQGNTVVTATPYVQGIWLVDDSDAPYSSSALPKLVRIDGRESQDFTIGEQSNTYYAIGRRDPVTIVDAVRGLEGSISGTLTDDANGYVDAFRWMKHPSRVGRTFRLVYAQTNIPVQLGEAHLSPLSAGGADQMYSMSVNVVQVGEFD